KKGFRRLRRDRKTQRCGNARRDHTCLVRSRREEVHGSIGFRAKGGRLHPRALQTDQFDSPYIRQELLTEGDSTATSRGIRIAEVDRRSQAVGRRAESAMNTST